MQTLTAEQFKKRYGEAGVASFSTPSTPKTDSYAKRVIDTTATDLNTRIERTNQILNRPDTGMVTKGVQLFGQGTGLAAKTLETTVGEVPGIKQTVGAIGSGLEWLSTSKFSPIKYVGDVIGSSKALQTAVQLYDTDQNFKDSVDAVANIVRLGGDVQMASDSVNLTKNVTNKILEKAKTVPDTVPPSPPDVGLPDTTVPNIVRDVLPTKERIVNTEVTKALDLTQGDVKNISMSTGNDVGEFLSSKNLIGENLDQTVKNIDDFYKTNYQAVRTEIDNVKPRFRVNEVPRYIESLTEIKKQINDVPGLQKANAEVNTLLGKKIVELKDVQRVKELMDEHFQLYKAVGDVKAGVAKTGLAKIRGDLRAFIETQVKENTGVDIKPLNNNVATARSIGDAIQTRSTRGLTRATITAGDIVTFLSGSAFGSPLLGAVAVLGKKIYQSPTFKLKFSKWLDGLNDAKRAEIKTQLEKGVLPKEIKIQSSKTSSNVSKAENSQSTKDIVLKKTQSTNAKNSSIPKASNKTEVKSSTPFVQSVKTIDEIYKTAPEAQKYINGVVTKLVDKLGGKLAVSPMNGGLKSLETAINKVKREYGGDFSQLTDMARNTYVASSEQAIEKAITALSKIDSSIRIVDSKIDPYGYSGVNVKVRAKNGHIAEIQINTPEMIYAKEPKNISKGILGDKEFNLMEKKFNGEGGKGHTYYEMERKEKVTKKQLEQAKKDSKAYYAKFR